MANPQIENGHTDIAHDYLEALSQAKLSGAEFRVLLVVIRKTWGWKKKTDKISYSQLVKATGLLRCTVIEAVQKLVCKNILVCKSTLVKNNLPINSFELVKDYDSWTSMQNHTGMEKPLKLVCKTRPTKETIQKKIYISPESEEILSFMNNLIGSSFTTKNKDTVKNISGRLGDGYTVADFKTVISKKHAQWGGDPKMVQNLNPSTLFRPSNFERYLNEASHNGNKSNCLYADYPQEMYENMPPSDYDKCGCERCLETKAKVLEKRNK